MSERTTWREEFRVDRGALRSTIRELCREARSTRVIIRNRQGKTVVNVSLIAAVVIAVLVPAAAIAATIGVLLDTITVSFVRTGDVRGK